MKARTLALSVLSLTISIPIATAYSGDLTYYTPGDAAHSSCAMGAAPGEAIVAISKYKMNNPANPNDNPLCGTYISIYNPNNQKTIGNVKIVDTCQGCAEDDIDVNVELFEALGFPQAAGRVQADWGGSAIGGKRSLNGLEPLTIVQVGKRELRHPHAMVERA